MARRKKRPIPQGFKAYIACAKKLRLSPKSRGFKKKMKACVVAHKRKGK